MMKRTSRTHRLIAVLLGAHASVAVGCGRAASELDSDAARSRPSDAGGVAEGISPLTVDVAPSEPVEVCNCSSVTYHPEAPSIGYVHQPLECRCGTGASTSCPARPEDVVTPWCETVGASPLVRMEGCGQVSFQTGGVFGGSLYTFDARSLVLIGAHVYTDSAFGECSRLGEESYAVGYIYGQQLFDGNGETEGYGVGATCPEVTYCTVCGVSAEYPPCP